jgi:hypothetical protein
MHFAEANKRVHGRRTTEDPADAGLWFCGGRKAEDACCSYRPSSPADFTSWQGISLGEMSRRVTVRAEYRVD